MAAAASRMRDGVCEGGHEMRRVFSMPAVKLKGPGYYATDYSNLDKQKAQGRERVERRMLASGHVVVLAGASRFTRIGGHTGAR